MLAWKITLFCMQDETNQGHEIWSLVSNRVAKWAVFVFDRVRVGVPLASTKTSHALPLGETLEMGQGRKLNVDRSIRIQNDNREVAKTTKGVFEGRLRVACIEIYKAPWFNGLTIRKENLESNWISVWFCIARYR